MDFFADQNIPSFLTVYRQMVGNHAQALAISYCGKFHLAFSRTNKTFKGTCLVAKVSFFQLLSEIHLVVQLNHAAKH